MAIYPIVDGQKLDQRNVIPPRNAGPAVNHQPTKTDQPKEVPPADDLIDFGQNDDSAPAPPAQPAATPAPASANASNSTQGHGEIENLLSSTGKPAEGPLIDFTNDLKKGLPQTKN